MKFLHLLFAMLCSKRNLVSCILNMLFKSKPVRCSFIPIIRLETTRFYWKRRGAFPIPHSNFLFLQSHVTWAFLCEKNCWLVLFIFVLMSLERFDSYVDWICRWNIWYWPLLRNREWTFQTMLLRLYWTRSCFLNSHVLLCGCSTFHTLLSEHGFSTVWMIDA